jgi:hypothetical protein
MDDLNKTTRFGFEAARMLTGKGLLVTIFDGENMPF